MQDTLWLTLAFVDSSRSVFSRSRVQCALVLERYVAACILRKV